MSYSCGKDSTLALHKMLAAGHEPAALVVMFNESAGRSFFHGADRPMLEAYGRALGLPVRPVPTAGETYHLAMETALVRITRGDGGRGRQLWGYRHPGQPRLVRSPGPGGGAEAYLPSLAAGPAGKCPGGDGPGLSLYHQIHP